MWSISRRYLLILAIMPFCGSLQAQINSDFNGNAQGWTTPNDADATITYNAAGGNPAGNVSGSPFVIVLGATTIYVNYYFVAPGAYTGNRSGYNNGTLQFDIQQSSTGVPTQQAEAVISNGGTSLYYYPASPFQPPAAPAWATFSVGLVASTGFWKTTDTPAGVAATQAQILGVLTNLTGLQIRGQYRDANTTTRLDNVSLATPIVVTTQPSSTAVCDGVTTTLTTAATGNPSITYQWQRETTPGVWVNVTNTGGYSGATTTTLSINTTGNFGAGSYRCRISGTAATDVFTSTAIVTVNALPGAPSTTGASSCSPASLTLSASGGAAGQYRWYTVAVAGTPIAGQTNSTYATPILGATTTYYVAINNGTCQGARSPVTATINTPPAAPTTTGGASCGPASLTLTAAGGSAGQYRWYTVSVGGTPIAGQTNSSYVTPSLSLTTTYYVAINNGTCESARSAVTATINTPPTAPTTTGSASCGPASLSLTATGGSAGQYRWYTVSVGGTPIAGQTNSVYVTPALSTTTTYFVAINNGTCESTRVSVTATINTLPTAPSVTGGASCTAGTVTLTASGGINGQYRWYTVSSGGTPLAGEVNGTYSTPVISTTTNYYVSIHNGLCESARTAVVATIAAPGCGNQPPVIQSTILSTQIEGIVKFSLVDLITDSDDNLDLSTLKIISPPSSGAKATIDAGHNLIIDYAGLAFNGTENITIEVCDIFAACVQQIFSIEVVGDIEIFDAVSPNGDGKNETFVIAHIDQLETTRQNHVTLFNRWGDLVWEGFNYNNTSVAFAGKSTGNNDLPSGIYFYKIEFTSGRKTQTGSLTLRK